MRRRSAAGDSKIGCMIWIAAAAVAALVAFKMIPVRVQVAELYDYMDEQAKFGAHNPPERLRRAIADKAKQLGLPVTEKQVQVSKQGESIRLAATFTVPIEFPGYTYNWDFDLEIKRDIFIF